MTLFSPDPTARTYWVQVRLEGFTFSVRVNVSQGFRDPDGTFHGPGIHITDYRAPRHPEINWTWIDKRRQEIMFNIPLADT